MPIEDVDYLKDNSIVQSYIFLVDSRDRDHEAYPTPSEYVVTFTAPFTNVIGLQLIDASIPRTMYNIDTYNNTIAFYIRAYGNTGPLFSNSNYKTVQIETGNYTVQTLLPVLTNALAMHINDDSTLPVARITARSVSAPPDLKNKIEFRCPYPFAFDMKGSTLAETLGFDLFPDAKEQYLYKKVPMPVSQSNQQVFGSVNITTSNSIYGTSTEESSYCNVLTQPLVQGSNALLGVSSNQYLAQRFTVPARSYLTSVAGAFLTTGVQPVPYSIVKGTVNTPSMNQLVSSGSLTVTGTNGALSTGTVYSPPIVEPGSNYWLVFGSNTIGAGSNTSAYYVSNVAGLAGTPLVRSSDTGLSWTANLGGGGGGSGYSNQLVTVIDSDLLYSSPVLSEPYNLFVGPRGVLRKLDVSSTKLVAQRFTTSTRTFLQTVRAAFATDTGNPVPFSVRIGTSTQPTMTTDGALFSSNMNIDFVNGTLSETTIGTPVLLLENVYYWLVFGGTGMVGGTSVYYNDINPYIGLHTLYSSADTGATWTTPDVAEINYQLSIQVTVADEYNRIEAPGIFNLVGEPYLVVRCPEIEQNSFRSLSFMKNTLGLAKINLGIVGYADPRFDYSSVPARDFHPIGKFSRMTLRFETSKGRPYDFKGVNHTITFAIRYYEPVQKKRFENSIINPNYNGDFMRYMFHRGDDNAEEDSDDDEEDYSRDNLGNYRVVEARNTPERLEYEDREMNWYYRD